MCELINLQSAPQYLEQSTKLAMSAGHKFILKKLRPELVHVRSTTKSSGQSARGLSKESPCIKEDCMISGENCSTNREKLSVGRKRKSPEVDEHPNIMSAGQKFILKKLRPEFVHVRSTTKSSGQSARGLSKESPCIKEDCMIFGENYSTDREKLSVGRKRKSPEVDEHPNSGDARMTLSRKRQCATVLIKLMNHTFGWVFNEPVDPVKLGIPDYFSIITKPMDLGTIKRKIENQHYSTTCMFAADVRLTFSNAMRYNPPDNFAHGYAKELSKIFDSSWKVLESKWRKECLITYKSAGVMKNHSESSTKDAHKGSGRARLVSGSVSEKTSKSNNLHGTTENHNCQHNDFTQAPAGDLDPERSCGQENLVSHSNTTNVGCKKTVSEQSGYSSPKSGPAIFDRGNTHPTHHSSLAASPRKDEDDPPPLELSPARALRAAMLKRRFSDTILKAQQRRLLDHGEKGDPIRMQREKEKLEKKQQEEMARIEEVKAAAQRKSEIEMKNQREKERVAARMILEKMERTADIDENRRILKELENLGCLQPLYTLEQLGLIIKDDLDEMDVEEGEFCIDY